MIAKYRVDFYYWTNRCGFESYYQTVERLNTFINAKEYVDNIDIDYFTKIPYDFTEIPYDAIMVRVMDNENDYVLSEYWWDIKN